MKPQFIHRDGMIAGTEYVQCPKTTATLPVHTKALNTSPTTEKYWTTFEKKTKK